MNPLLVIYRDYLECLNNQAWHDLGNFVYERVRYNKQEIGLAGYLSMLERNYQEIPDLFFQAELLITNSTYLASRIEFDCSPVGNLWACRLTGAM